MFPPFRAVSLYQLVSAICEAYLQEFDRGNDFPSDHHQEPPNIILFIPSIPIPHRIDGIGGSLQAVAVITES